MKRDLAARDLAVFDLCGTLYECNLLFAFAHTVPSCAAACRKADTPIVKALDALFPRKQIRRRMYFRAIRALSSEQRADHVERFVRDQLPAKRRDKAFQALESKRASGWRIALLSGAPNCIVRGIAEELGVDAYVGAPLAFNDVWQDTATAKERLLRAFEPFARLYVCTDNPDDERLLHMADDYLVFSSAQKLNWWFRRVDPMRVHLKSSH